MDPATQMVIDGQQAFGMINALMWNLLRIGALLMAMPLIGTRAVSVRVRVIMASALSMALTPMLPPTPGGIDFDAATVLNVARELARRLRLVDELLADFIGNVRDQPIGYG